MEKGAKMAIQTKLIKKLMWKNKKISIDLSRDLKMSFSFGFFLLDHCYK